MAVWLASGEGFHGRIMSYEDWRFEVLGKHLGAIIVKYNNQYIAYQDPDLLEGNLGSTENIISSLTLVAENENEEDPRLPDKTAIFKLAYGGWHNRMRIEHVPSHRINKGDYAFRVVEDVGKTPDGRTLTITLPELYPTLDAAIKYIMAKRKEQ